MPIEKIETLVIGAGIAGLTAAHYLNKAGFDVRLLEKEARAGGRLSTIKAGNALLETGAQFLLPGYKNVKRLAHELGLNYGPLEGKGFLLRELESTHFLPLRSGPLSVLFYSGLGRADKSRLALHCLSFALRTLRSKSERPQVEESTAEFFQKRISPALVQRLLDPLTRAFLLHDARQLSVGMFFKLLNYVSLRPRLETFVDGMSSLPRALAETLPISYHIKVLTVRRESDAIRVRYKNLRKNTEHTLLAGRVIMALPGNLVLPLLNSPLDEEKRFLQSVRYASTTSILLRSRVDISKNALYHIFPARNSPVPFYALGKARIPSSGNWFNYNLMLSEHNCRNIEKEVFSNEALLIEWMERLNGSSFKFELIGSKTWKSAIPIFYPGYSNNLSHFLSNNGADKIYYCGDYTAGPGLEQACLSGKKIADNILQSKRAL